MPEHELLLVKPSVEAPVLTDTESGQLTANERVW